MKNEPSPSPGVLISASAICPNENSNQSFLSDAYQPKMDNSSSTPARSRSASTYPAFRLKTPATDAGPGECDDLNLKLAPVPSVDLKWHRFGLNLTRWLLPAEPPGLGEEVYIIEAKEAFRNKEYPLTWVTEHVSKETSTAMKEEKKKWAMPKFFPHKYDVSFINEDKVIVVMSQRQSFPNRAPNHETALFY
ncbi:tyrosine-protein kinase BAZ1B isoform X1 [Lates japonicus]|uniref:Tyrosine-protein kinase BAZ1B isoform X1 n=1 Tax=Lates japonicus TaxID=270547 RepID=A0AAD3MP04_LATJO|nr:tyrosine-protein kinase BAZ1B isoform X1 [Lates japonicus]